MSIVLLLFGSELKRQERSQVAMSLCFGHLEDIGSLSHMDLPNADTFCNKISKKKKITLIKSPLISKGESLRICP